MTTKRPTTKAPAGLGSAGRALWASILGDLAPDLELDHRELALLERACTSADRIAELEALLERDGPMTSGSAGQPVLHPAVAESRLQKTTLLQLLRALDLEGDGGRGTATSQRGRRGAASRWGYRQSPENQKREKGD